MIIGLVGKPSSGKSTFFKAATLAEVEIANYPFTTINKNEGFGYVKVDCVDVDFGKQCNPRTGFCINHKRFVPVMVIDVAGLVPNAHLGRGRGNQFLDDLRQADVLIHVVDGSGSLDSEGNPIERGSHDPAKDILFLEKELDFWYLGIINKGWEKLSRTTIQEKKQIHSTLGKQLSGLKVTEKMVELAMEELGLAGKKPTDWSQDDLMGLAVKLRQATKPMVIGFNKIDVPGAADNYERVRKEFPHLKIYPCSAEAELALREAAKHGLIDYAPGDPDFQIKEPDKLRDNQKKALEFVRESILKKWGTTGIQDMFNSAVFDFLKYIAIFPGGTKKLEDSEGRTLPDCFIMPPGTTALGFAFSLHTDLGEGFIRAIDVKRKLTVGKEHALQHRDVIEIVSSK